MEQQRANVVVLSPRKTDVHAFDLLREILRNVPIERRSIGFEEQIVSMQRYLDSLNVFAVSFDRIIGMKARIPLCASEETLMHGIEQSGFLDWHNAPCHYAALLLRLKELTGGMQHQEAEVLVRLHPAPGTCAESVMLFLQSLQKSRQMPLMRNLHLQQQLKRLIVCLETSEVQSHDLRKYRLKVSELSLESCWELLLSSTMGRRREYPALYWALLERLEAIVTTRRKYAEH